MRNENLLAQFSYEAQVSDIGLELIEQCDIGLILINENYKIIFWNQWIEQHIGHTKNQVLGLNLLELYPVLVSGRIKSAIDQAFKNTRSSFLSHHLHNNLFPLTLANHLTKIEHSVALKPIQKSPTQKYCLIEIYDSMQLVKYERLIAKQSNEIKNLNSDSSHSHTLNQAIFDLSFDCLFIIDDRGRIKHCNSVAESNFSYSNQEIKGSLIQSLLEKPGNQPIDLKKDFNERIYELPLIGVDKFNKRFPALVSVNRLGDINNNKFLIIIHNETRQQEIENQLASVKSRSELTLNSISDAVIVTNPQGLICFMNAAAEQITAWSRADAIGQAAHIILSLMDASQVQPLLIYDHIPESKNGRSDSSLYQAACLKRKDRMNIDIEFAVSRLNTEHGKNLGKKSGLVIVLRDLTERRNAAQKIAWQASHDTLTGLVNRHEFEQKLTQLLNKPKSEEQEHALLHLDIDQFKVVNDLCGHLAGDELLRKITLLLSSILPLHAILARYSSDEFGILLLNHSIRKANEFSSKIHSELKEFRFRWQDQVFSLAVSIGLVPINQDSKDPINLLSFADTACFFAKESGRNRTYSATNRDEKLVKLRDEMRWISRIQFALDNHNIVLYGQAIIPLQLNGKLKPRIEILARMRDGNQLISPANFVAAAERYDLMPILDKEIISKTLSTFNNLNIRDEFHININLSAKSINDESFLSFLITEINDHCSLKPANICFEITETAAITNFEMATNFITQLQAIGCEFALDDFGSGLSSIAYLKCLPVNYLKIDGSFVRNILENNKDLEMLKIINRLGKVMNVKTIAEYVENDNLIKILRDIGVDYGQGYAISRPQPLENLIDPTRKST